MTRQPNRPSFQPRQRRQLEPPPTPLWFKVWFVFFALLGVGVIGVGVWAAIKVVNHVTGG